MVLKPREIWEILQQTTITLYQFSTLYEEISNLQPIVVLYKSDYNC